MAFKINVGLSRKIGQPNFGSFGASCHIDLEIDPQALGHGAEAIQREILDAFAICKHAVDAELAKCDRTQADDARSHARSVSNQTNSSPEERPDRSQATASGQQQQKPSRPATPAQIKAIHAIAGKAGIDLSGELGRRFGIRSPQQLSISQASEMIDHLKQSLTPAPA
jgi:hypothetical protein